MVRRTATRLIRALAAVLALAAVQGCSTGARPDGEVRRAATASPSRILERAIAQAGGRDALTRARALTWEGDAIVKAGRIVQISGTWAIQPPDTGIVSTFDVAVGPGTMRSLVVAAPRGWLIDGDSVRPMPGTMLAAERDEFYLYDVMRLVPLTEPEVTLSPIPPDSLGQYGFRAEREGRPSVDVHVDTSGRLSHLRTRLPNPAGGEPVLQDIWFDGTIESQGVRWPRDLRIYFNGDPFFALTLRTLQVRDRLDDPRLRGPG